MCKKLAQIYDTMKEKGEKYRNMNIIICDDIKEYADKIYSIVKNYFARINLPVNIQTYNSGKTMLKESDLKSTDILFLDVEMDEKNGMEVAEEIRNMNFDIYIVYVSSHIQYASEGYKYEAVRYVLKNKLLTAGIEESLSSIIKRKNNEKRKMIFSFTDKKRTIDISELLYIESRKHKLIFFVYENQKTVEYEMYGKLSMYEKELKLYGFERVHQSFLVNMHCVTGYKRYEVELKSGEQISVPRARYNEVAKLICKYMGE